MDSESDDDIEACEICHEPYDDDPDLFVGRAEREQSHLPVQSSTCQHFLCYNCVVRKRMADGEKLSDKAFENLKWLKCPFCRRLTSFNTADPNVSHFACQMLRRLRRHRSKETMRPGATDDTTGSGETAPSGASADHSQEEANAPPAAVSAGACTDFAERGDSESIDGDPTDEEQNFPLDAVTAASAATAEEGGEEEAVQGAETVADGDISDEDHRPIEENEDILTENIEEVVDPSYDEHFDRSIEAAVVTNGGSSDNGGADIGLESGGAEGEGKTAAVIRSGKRKSHPEEDAHRTHGVGDKVRKSFPGHGVFEGKITKIPTDEFPYYRVEYEDGDSEDINANDVSQYVAEYKKFCHRNEPAEDSIQQGAGQNEDTEDVNNEVAGPSESSDPFSTDAEWIAASSDNTVRVCRIKIFCKKSQTASDKYGRLSSLWCVDKGYIASANRVVPEGLLSDPAKALKYLREEKKEEIKERCLLSPLFPNGEAVSHLKEYLTFAKLRPGDIIILQLKGDKNKDPGVAIFGVVEDDSFLIKSKDEVFEDESHAFPGGFPWVLDHGERHDPYANGLMLRKIKWMRHGIIRSLPMQIVTKKGTNQATWMHECGTSFFLEVTNQGKDRLKDIAFSAMRSEEFLEKTKCLDQAWIVSEAAKWQMQ